MSVGQPAPAVLEGVRQGEVALVRGPAGLTLVRGRVGGGTVSSVVEVSGGAGDAFPVSLAIEALRDSAAVPTPAPAPRPANAYVYYEYERPPVEREMRATPTLYMKLLAGYSPVRDHWLIGPGAGLGLCVGGNCLVIEADLPLLPEEIVWEGYGTLRYRAVSTAIRLQVRPVIRDRWSFGVNIGALSRIGNATLEHLSGEEVRRRATNFGARVSTELAVRIAGPFEVVGEIGFDWLKDRAVFRYEGNPHFLEDKHTPWITFSVRMRPFQR